jgi:hypothetical protein
MNYIKKLLFIAFMVGGLCIEAMDEWQEYAFRGHRFSIGQDVPAAYLFDGIASVFSPEELVFVREPDDSLVPATVLRYTSPNEYEVELISTSTLRSVSHEQIQKLSLLGHVLYQPNVSCRGFRDTVDYYLHMFPRPPHYFVQSCMLKPEKKIIVVGDLHGCFDPLESYLKEWYEKGIITKDLILDPEYCIVFTGDYIDRGQNCLEVLYTLMTLQISNPFSVFLIRGNHEQVGMIGAGDFYDEWLFEFGDNAFAEESWSRLFHMFDSMPVAVILGHKIDSLYDCILFSHGGIENIPNFLGYIVEQHVANPTPEIIMIHEFEGLTEHNGFSWLDFYAHGYSSPTLVRNSLRGGGLLAWSWQFLSDCLQRDQSSVDSSKPYSYILRAVCRGHQHMEGGITRLLQQEDRHGQSWRSLKNMQECRIARGDVFTFFSASDAVPSAHTKHYAYGVVSLKNNEWTLTPYIKEFVLMGVLPS